jgi:carbamoyltransferase
VFTDHHESHAASAFFPSPFDEAAILTLDGVGEWSTACFGIGRENRIQLTDEIMLRMASRKPNLRRLARRVS